MSEVKLYNVKREYRHLYDNKFINNKASIAYWESVNVDLNHLDGYRDWREHILYVGDVKILGKFIDWYENNYSHKINKDNIDIFLKEFYND